MGLCMIQVDDVVAKHCSENPAGMHERPLCSMPCLLHNSTAVQQQQLQAARIITSHFGAAVTYCWTSEATMDSTASRTRCSYLIPAHARCVFQHTLPLLVDLRSIQICNAPGMPFLTPVVLCLLFLHMSSCCHSEADPGSAWNVEDRFVSEHNRFTLICHGASMTREWLSSIAAMIH